MPLQVTHGLVLSLLCSVALGAQPLSWETVIHQGIERTFGWYAGSGVGIVPAPVVLVLHGGGGSASQVWRGDEGRSWRRLADEHGPFPMLSTVLRTG